MPSHSLRFKSSSTSILIPTGSIISLPIPAATSKPPPPRLHAVHLSANIIPSFTNINVWRVTPHRKFRSLHGIEVQIRELGTVTLLSVDVDMKIGVQWEVFACMQDNQVFGNAVVVVKRQFGFGQLITSLLSFFPRSF